MLLLTWLSIVIAAVRLVISTVCAGTLMGDVRRRRAASFWRRGCAAIGESNSAAVESVGVTYLTRSRVANLCAEAFDFLDEVGDLIVVGC